MQVWTVASGPWGASYCSGSVMERSTYESDREERGEKRERESNHSCRKAVSKASPHCRGNHLVCLTGVAKAIRQRAWLLRLVSSLEKSEGGLEREILCQWWSWRWTQDSVIPPNSPALGKLVQLRNQSNPILLKPNSPYCKLLTLGHHFLIWNYPHTQEKALPSSTALHKTLYHHT